MSEISRPPDSGTGETRALAVVTDLISGICDVDEDDLPPDRRIGELGIDSILAGEIMAQAELALGIDIDFRQVRDDWSMLTLKELASELWNQSSGGGQLGGECPDAERSRT